MGVVWEGRHVAQRVPVAVKLITHAAAREASFGEMLRDEVRAVARLDHPSIVHVLDQGTVTPAEHAASDKRLPKGSPWFAMELATGGDLGGRVGRVSWPALRQTLLELLEALGHAHARGLVHRDLKPANVLVAAPNDLRPGLKLSDFGLAHAAGRYDQERTDARENAMGTPRYMAPEQFRGAWRDFGPWTDLYALGCIAWQLATGKAPFEAPSLAEMVGLHLHAEPIPPPGDFPVPDGFWDWARALLRKDPMQRPRRAVDVAWALTGLGDPPDPGRATAATLAWGQAVTPPTDLPGTSLGTADTEEVSVSALPPPSAPPRSGGRPSTPPGTVAFDGLQPAPAGRAPLPADWRTDAPRAPLRLLGAGTRMFGLRVLPVVGREGARDRLWGALREVGETGAARAVVIRGATGAGKSRLAEWLAWRAHEVAAATVLQAKHAPSAGPSLGLGRMVERALRTVGLVGNRLAERLYRIGLHLDFGHGRPGLPGPLWMALLGRPDPDRTMDAGDAGGLRASLLERLLRILGERAPVVLVLDDVQWGADALELAHALLEASGEDPLRLLLVLTVREEALPERAAEAELLASLVEREDVDELTLAPLSERERGALVRDLLALEGPIAAEVEERSGGNPLFAVQIVADWVERGVLVPGDEGFRLADDAAPALPADLAGAWSARVTRLLEGRPGWTADALRLAALLGPEVDLGEWRDACAGAGLAGPRALATGLRDLAGDLAAQSLAVREESGWSFVHGMLRESVVAGVEADRLGALHGICADTLAALGPPGESGPERLGGHLLAAGRVEEAMEPLLEAARRRYQRGAHGAALRLLEQRERELDGEGPRWDRHRVLGWLLRSEIHGSRADLTATRAWTQPAIDLAARHGWHDLQATGEWRAASEAMAVHDVPEALRRADESRRLAALAGDKLGEARGMRLLANTHRMAGNFEAAAALAAEARPILEAVGDRFHLASLARIQGGIEESRRDFDRAMEFLADSAALYEELGNLSGRGAVLNNLGEVHRLRGDLDLAADAYLESIRLYDLVGSGFAHLSRLNLALVHILQGRWPDAARQARPAAAYAERKGWLNVWTGLHLVLVGCAAAEGDWAVFDERLAVAEELFARSRFAHEDALIPLQGALETCAREGQTERWGRAKGLFDEIEGALPQGALP